MATAARIRKLHLGTNADQPVTSRTSTAGMTVIADYIDPSTNQRTLVLERSERKPSRARLAASRTDHHNSDETAESAAGPSRRRKKTATAADPKEA